MKKSAVRHKILVLDGDHKNALAIVRHLGKTKDYEIDVVSGYRHSIAFLSKYASGKYIVSDARLNPDKYIGDILSIVQGNDYLVIIPVSFTSFHLCSLNSEKIKKYTYLIIASPWQIETAINKIKTYRLAKKIGVPFPETLELNSIDELEKINPPFPCVIKSPFETGKTLVEYASNKEELVRKYKKMCSENDFRGALPFIQKYIEGEGAGFFAYYKNGECKSYFMHRRIREYPVKGGPSTAAEGLFNKQILRDGKKILDELKWEGVAMVEFKKDNSTGIFNLMEINAKFWGSLDLALISGVNFPQMFIDEALGKEVTHTNYKLRRFQWILNGDLFHLIERPWHAGSFLLDLFRAKNDIWIRDVKPNLYQLMYIPVHYFKKWSK
ncbi:MAG: carboxylate--amine ligase [Bacteroidales bacterium]